MSASLYHGGVPGLGPGSVLKPGHSRDDNHPGCLVCEQRRRGVSSIDPASARQDRVYVTEDKEYARFHASLYGAGDLYVVEALGALERSAEDRFPSWTCEGALVLDVLARGVLLTPTKRKRLFLRWAELDGVSANQAEAEWRRVLHGTGAWS